MAKFHVTFDGFIDQEISPAISAGEGVGPDFDIMAFANAVSAYSPGQGFYLAVDESTFWAVCERFDAAADGDAR